MYFFPGSQYSDYLVLDYLCLPGESLSVCDSRLISTSAIDQKHRLLIRSPNYPQEYENSLNCSCEITTMKSQIELLDFYLEERDEMNFCSRDYLQIGDQSYCDSNVDRSIALHSSTHLTFKTNDVITRKGFWLMISSDQAIQASCRNSFEAPFPFTTITSTITTTMSHSPALNTTSNSSKFHSTRHYTLSFILILTIIFVVALLLLNLLLIILCWRQRRSKDNLNSKIGTTHRPFFCSKRSETSSSSSITYGETPVLTSLDPQKRQTTSTTTATTGTYEDPNELLTLQRQQKFHPNHSLYLQHRHEPKTFCPIVLPSSSTNTGYNPMIHFPVGSMHCHFATSAQTFYPLDSQHIYETIQDGQCPYQRLAATLRRQQQCTCHGAYTEQKPSTRTDDQGNNMTIESNPETLVWYRKPREWTLLAMSFLIFFLLLSLFVLNDEKEKSTEIVKRWGSASSSKYSIHENNDRFL